MNAKNSALGHENQILAEGEACNRHEQQRHIFFNSHTHSRVASKSTSKSFTIQAARSEVQKVTHNEKVEDNILHFGDPGYSC